MLSWLQRHARLCHVHRHRVEPIHVRRHSHNQRLHRSSLRRCSSLQPISWLRTRPSVCLSVPTIDSSDVCRRVCSCRRVCCSASVLRAADIDRHSCECRTAAAGGFAAQCPSCVQQILANTAAGVVLQLQAGLLLSARPVCSRY